MANPESLGVLHVRVPKWMINRLKTRGKTSGSSVAGELRSILVNVLGPVDPKEALQ